VAAPVYPAGVFETALLHDFAGSGVVDEEITPKGTEAFHVEAVVYHQAEGFRAYSFVPVWFPDPVADLGIILTYSDVAFATRVISHAADRLSGLVQLNRPSVVICEYIPYHIKAFFHTFMRRPSRPWADLRIGSVLVQRLSIAFSPWTQCYPVRLHFKNL